MKKKWGLQSPSQVIDMLGLMGDAVDNIPGCPGVGEKTAQKLIEEFGSIENLLASTQKLKGALKEKVENNVEQIKQSKWLATINQEVPISLDMELLQLQEPDNNKLQELFKRLEFRQLLNKKPSPLPTSPMMGRSFVNDVLFIFYSFLFCGRDTSRPNILNS